MSPHAVADYAAIPPKPWKNGRGVTRNLFDDADAAGDWTWRISIAEITGTQPYSAYPGVRRGQVALGPGDVDLLIDGRAVRLPVEGVIVFDGESEVSATPHEPGFLDLNVMTRRDAWTSEVEVVDDPIVTVDDTEIVVLVALDDRCAIDGRELHRLDAARLATGSTAALTGRWARARLQRV